MGERHTPEIKKNGVVVGRGRNLDFIEGANTTITMAYDEQAHEVDVTIAATGVGTTITVQEDDVTVDALAGTLDFRTGLDVTSAPAGEANISVDTSELTLGGELAGTVASATVNASHSGSAHHTQSHDHSAAGDGTTLTPATLNIPSAAAPAQTAEGQAVWDSDDDKLTIGDGAARKTLLDTGHEGAADPHTGYRLESADHTHQTTGAQAGQLDHGLALTGLTDDDHTQYRLESADHTHQTTGAQAGTLDHGLALTGLTDDDHTQYRLESADIQSITFTKTGTLAVGTGATRWYNDTGRSLTLQSARGSVGTQPTGASILIDVNNNGTSVWNTTQANRITIAVSTNTDEGGAFDDTTIADGEYITVDIDQIGSTVAGSDLTVTIWWTS